MGGIDMDNTRKTSTTHLEAEQQFLASLHDSLDDLHEKIAERAYVKAEARGFECGHEMEDWLEAEQELRATTNPLGNVHDNAVGTLPLGTAPSAASERPVDQPSVSLSGE
jgi:Protein of unknown function (DUF2934)